MSFASIKLEYSTYDMHKNLEETLIEKERGVRIDTGCTVTGSETVSIVITICHFRKPISRTYTRPYVSASSI